MKLKFVVCALVMSGFQINSNIAVSSMPELLDLQADGYQTQYAAQDVDNSHEEYAEYLRSNHNTYFEDFLSDECGDETATGDAIDNMLGRLSLHSQKAITYIISDMVNDLNSRAGENVTKLVILNKSLMSMVTGCREYDCDQNESLFIAVEAFSPISYKYIDLEQRMKQNPKYTKGLESTSMIYQYNLNGELELRRYINHNSFIIVENY